MTNAQRPDLRWYRDWPTLYRSPDVDGHHLAVNISLAAFVVAGLLTVLLLATYHQ